MDHLGPCGDEEVLSIGSKVLALPKDLGLSTKSNLRVLDAEVGIHAVLVEVGVHARLPINEVFGFVRTIQDRDLDPHALLYASAMVLTTTIGVITLIMKVIVVVVTTGWTRVLPTIVLSIMMGSIVHTWRYVGWGLMVVARIVQAGILVSALISVTPRAV